MEVSWFAYWAGSPCEISPPLYFSLIFGMCLYGQTGWLGKRDLTMGVFIWK